MKIVFCEEVYQSQQIESVNLREPENALKQSFTKTKHVLLLLSATCCQWLYCSTLAYNEFAVSI